MFSIVNRPILYSVYKIYYNKFYNNSTVQYYRNVYKYIIIYNLMGTISNTIETKAVYFDVHKDNIHNAIEKQLKKDKEYDERNGYNTNKPRLGIRGVKSNVQNLHFNGEERKIVCEINILKDKDLLTSTIIAIPLDSIFEDMLSSEIDRLINLQTMLKKIEE